MLSLKSGLCVLFAFTVNVLTAKNMKDAIGFPEVEENHNLKNRENRQPVYVPSICTENELYYPGDQKDDWICDCRPAYIYHPKSDSCWPAWRQGPCNASEYLTLKNDTVIPSCEPNPCKKDGAVIFDRLCWNLGATAPCVHMYPIPAALGVNATNLAIECVHLKLDNRFGDNNFNVELMGHCVPGSKRCFKENKH